MNRGVRKAAVSAGWMEMSCSWIPMPHSLWRIAWRWNRGTAWPQLCERCRNDFVRRVTCVPPTPTAKPTRFAAPSKAVVEK